MSFLTESVDYENLDYGCYSLNDESLYSENVKYVSAYFNKLGIRKIRLPNLGRGNIIYILSNSFENSLKLLDGKNFIIPPNYRKVYYPWIAFGSFMGRRYRFNLNKLRGDRVNAIKNAGFTPYGTRNLLATPENIFFIASDIYEAVMPLIKRFPIKRVYESFFKEFDDIIFKQMTPVPKKKGANEDWNNRITIIDVDSFVFKPGAPLEENKTNPLFLLYLAFLRHRSLSVINVDREYLITSKNLFLKFNPAKTAIEDWPKFKLALFRIMKTNMDDYLSTLKEEEIKEINEGPEETVTKTIIKDRLDPIISKTSPDISSKLINLVSDKLLNKAIENRNKVYTIKSELDAVSKSLGVEFEPTRPKNPIIKGLSSKDIYPDMSYRRLGLFNALIKDYESLSTDTDDEYGEDYENAVETEVDILSNDDETLVQMEDEIQEKIVPMKELKKSPVSSARDLKLREAQKHIKVRESTIAEILERDSSNIPVEVSDKSAVMKTSNENMKQLTFANFDKTYLEQVYVKDIVNCFDMLQESILLIVLLS